MYTHRIRSFKHYHSRFHGRISPEFLETLGLCFPGEQVFPNLGNLEWIVKEPASFPHVRLFLGPRITSLTLGVCASAAHLSFLPTLATQCPMLTEVEITFSKEMELFSEFQSLSLFVRSLARLKTLAVPSLDRAALEHVAQLPKFTSLTLTNQFQMIPAAEPLDPPSGRASSSLKSLSIEGTTVAALTNVIPWIVSASVDDVDVLFLKSTRSITQLHASRSSLLPSLSGMAASGLPQGLRGYPS